MANNKKFTSDEVRSLIEEVISEERDIEVESVEQSSSDDSYFSVILNGDITLSTLNKIARKMGSNYVSVGAEEFSQLSLFFKPEETDDDSRTDYDPYEEEREELARHPHIELKHKDRFYDVWDDVVPGTDIRRSRTEECELLMKYVNASGHLPIYFMRLNDGIHMEQSKVFTAKVRAILADGHAVGFDGRHYTFEDPDNLFPIGSDICVRATCDETGNSDAYGLSFFI